MILLSFEFALAVNAAVNPILPIRQFESVGQFLLDGSDAAGIPAADNIGDPLRQFQGMLFHDLIILDDIDGDFVVQNSQYIQVNVKGSLDFDDILLAHLVAPGILNDGNGIIQFLQV